MAVRNDDVLARARQVAAGWPGLALLVLHGSRARGEAGPTSDWDFAYAGGSELDLLALAAELGAAIGTDRIDLADLERSTGLLRFRAARDGVLVHESTEGLFDRFCLEAIGFWCDAGPLIRVAYEGVLAQLDQPLRAGIT